MFSGSIFGGQMAAFYSIRFVLLFSGALLLMNALWVYFTVYKERNLPQKTEMVAQG